MIHEPVNLAPETATVLEAIHALLARVAPFHPEIGKVPIRVGFDEATGLVSVAIRGDDGAPVVLEMILADPHDRARFGRRVLEALTPAGPMQ